MTKVHNAIELHDSEVESIMQVGDKITVIFSAAYIHKYENDCGTGWAQVARFVFENAEISGALPELPCLIRDGSVRAGDKPSGLIPIEFEAVGDIEMNLTFDTLHSVLIRGRRMTIELSGNAKFVENLPWKSPQV